MMIDVRNFTALAERVLPGARILHARRLTGGVSADVHALTLADADGYQCTVVVRQHAAAEWKQDHRHLLEREYALMQTLYLAGVPVPQPILLDTSGELLPEPVMVTAFVDGTSQVTADALNTSLDAMADMLLQLHRLPADILPELPARMDPLPELFQYLPDRPICRDLRKYLDGCDNSAFRGRPVLLHGDFWPENLLWRDGRLVAILDWEDAALGDPLSDVAGSRLELLWRYGRSAMDRFTRVYARQQALDSRRLALWEIYVASAAAHFMGAWGLDPDPFSRL